MYDSSTWERAPHPLAWPAALAITTVAGTLAAACMRTRLREGLDEIALTLANDATISA